MLTKLGRVVAYFDGLLSKKSHDSFIWWSWEVMWQTKTVMSLHYHSAYGHQIRQYGNLPWWTPANKVTWPFDYMVLWDHVTKYKHYISSTAPPMATKLGRMMTYLDWLLPIKSHDHMITWSCKITWQTKVIIYPLTPIFMGINFGRVGIYNEELASIKSLDPLIAWSCKVT